jgi:hypothetical protein
MSNGHAEQDRMNDEEGVGTVQVAAKAELL